MKALKTCSAYGKQIETTETFQVPGNVALQLCLDDDAEFCDEDGRRAKEEAFERTAKELAAPVDFQTLPQFSAPTKRNTKPF